jgi:archaetidylserine synthase
MKARDIMRAAFRDEWDGLERINRDIRLADFFTLGNALLGLGAIFAAMEGEIHLALQLILVGVIVDGVDGGVARLGYGGGPLGGPLDSLADAITFVAAPVTIIAATLDAEGMRSHIMLIAPLIFYGFCGLLRLARFEAIRTNRPRGYFSGLSSPGAALVLISLVMLDFEARWMLAAAVLLAVLMVSRVRFPKMRGWLAGAASTTIFVVLFASPWPERQEIATWAMLALMLVYLTTGPFYVLMRFGAVGEARPGRDA